MSEKSVSPSCYHAGDKIKIGQHYIYAAGAFYLTPENMASYDLRVLLRDEQKPSSGIKFGHTERGFLWLPIRDLHTVPEDCWNIWRQKVVTVAKAIQNDQNVIVFCAGGHGRTGLFLSCLLSHLVPEIEDPVSEVRQKYCVKAVETLAQEAQVKRFHNEELSST